MVTQNVQHVQKFNGVVVPHAPTMDKVLAVVLAERGIGKDLDVYFWGHNQCPGDKLAEFRSQGLFPIDLGGDKYHSDGADLGSAARVVGEAFGLLENARIRRLVELIDKNNRTGYLKGLHLSIVWIIRELYELGREYQMGGVVRRAMGAVNAFVDAPEEAPVDRSFADLRLEFPDLIEATEGRSGAGPLTLRSYLVDLWYLGLPPGVIRERIEWWLSAFQAVKTAQMEGDEEYGRIRDTLHALQVSDRWTIRLIAHDNKFVIRAAAKDSHVLVARSVARGQVAVMLRKGVQLGDEFYETILEREPEIWHHQEQTGLLVNGGLMYPQVPGTALTDDQLIELVRKHLLVTT